MKIVGNLLIILGFVPLYLLLLAPIYPYYFHNVRDAFAGPGFLAMFPLAIMGLGYLINHWCGMRSVSRLDPLVENISRLCLLFLIVSFGLAFLPITLLWVAITFFTIRKETKEGITTKKDALLSKVHWLLKHWHLNLAFVLVSLLLSPFVSLVIY